MCGYDFEIQFKSAVLNDNEDEAIGYQCSGTIFHENFVLTAGHCCKNKHVVYMHFNDFSANIEDKAGFSSVHLIINYVMLYYITCNFSNMKPFQARSYNQSIC